jgi:hypothetical protein
VDELLNEKNEPDVEKPEETADDPGSSGKSGKVRKKLKVRLHVRFQSAFFVAFYVLFKLKIHQLVRFQNPKQSYRL